MHPDRSVSIARSLAGIARAVVWCAIIVAGVVRVTAETRKSISNVALLHCIFRGTVASHIVSSGSPYVAGVMYARRGLYADAVRMFASVEPQTSLVRQQLARAKGAVGDWSGALAVFDRSKPSERAWFAGVLLQRLSKGTQQDRDWWLDRLRSGDPDLVAAYAERMLAESNYTEARLWAVAVTVEPFRSQARMVEGKSYFYTGEFVEAERVFKSLHLEFQDATSAYWWGRSALFLKDGLRAIELLERAVTLEQDPSRAAWFLGDLGAAYALAGRCAESRAAFGRAIHQDPRRDNIARISELRTRAGACAR